MNNNFFKIKDLLKYDKKNFKIIIGARSAGVKHFIELERYKTMTKTEKHLIDLYKDKIILGVALCDFYKIDYKDYFKEKYLYVYANYLKRNIFNATSKNIYLLELWQKMRVYLEVYEKFKTYKNLNNKFSKSLRLIEEAIKQLDLFFSNDIIKLSERRKEMKNNAKKAYNKEYYSKKESKEII